MATPEIGDIWRYMDGTNNYFYLILDTGENPDKDSDRKLIATLLRLDNGEIYKDYVWANHTWVYIS